MISFLFFIAGVLIAVVVMMIAYQKKNKEYSDRISSLLSDISAKQREAELLDKQLADNKVEHERLMDETKSQFTERINEINCKNEREIEERTILLDKQFAERLKLIQEQLNTTTERLLKQRSEELDNSNRSQMTSIIAPLKEVMAEMKKSMDDNRDSFNRNTASLSEQLKQMHATTTNLGVEAEKLSKALQTGPKIQGDFGEMKLNDLLDKFGFTKGVEYDVQYTMRDSKGNVIRNDDSDNRMRPDVVLHYPDHKDVIIDSKASLTAFISYVNAENDEERKVYLDEHVKSVRRHVDELSAKNYSRYSIEGGTTLDFVIMFVPQEAAMQLAVSADTMLWNYAFEHNVIITGEQNLFSLLRLLQIAWTQQHQAENQEKVFDMASVLIDRVQLFVERFDRLGNDINGIHKSYEEAKKAMNGTRGFIGSAHKLVDMGVKINPKKKKLPDIVDE